MKRLALGVAIAAALITPTQAAMNETLSYAIPAIFNSECEKLPEKFMFAMSEGIWGSSTRELSASWELIQTMIAKVGKEEFCRHTKPIVLRAVTKWEANQ